MTAKDERVRIYLGDNAATAGADVGEDAIRFGVGAERVEIEIVDRWALGFIERGTTSLDMLHVGR